MERKTRKHLDCELKIVNSMTKETYVLEHATGGYKLYNFTMGNEITPYRLSSREMFFVLQAIKRLLEQEKKA